MAVLDYVASLPTAPVPLPLEAPLLSLENVQVRFGKLIAVDSVSFDLRGGDFLGLLGANGAGKTTIMRAICGLQSIRHGDIRLMGEVLTDSTNHLLRHIGFTPDTPPLYDGLTVRQFLRFIGKQYDLDRDDTDERIDFWLEKLWLTDKADATIKGLSRGMRQRIGIARTLLPNPALVVLDEPAAGLDPNSRVQFRNLLADLRKQGKALIVSSHVLSDLADQCTHIGLMMHGRMTRFEPIAQFTGSHQTTHCRYRVALVDPPADLLKIIEPIEGIDQPELHDGELTFEASKSPAAAAELLSAFIGRGLKVAAFSPIAVNLEEAYRRASEGRLGEA